MQLKIPSVKTFTMMIFLGFVSFVLIYGNFSRNSRKDDLAGFIPSAPVSFSLPVRLNIPSINVDANFEYVGFTADGTMGVPKEPADVAWYNLGPRPGEIGSAVVAGHSGWKDNKPAVFDNLYKIQKGNKIYIEDEKGVNIVFVVREIKIYTATADSKDIFVSDDGISHLNLITCEGSWNEFTKSHSNRLVVFTEKEVKW